MVSAPQVDLAEYRKRPDSLQRERSLMNLIGTGQTVLDIGARDGHHSRGLRGLFDSVTSLDLEMPTVEGCFCVVGDVQNLQFPHRSFDAVLCAEVLEHVPDVEAAANEIACVAKHRIVVGVPYRQDLRKGRVRCGNCGKVSGPYGHIHSFDENRIRRLFPGWTVEFELVAENREWSSTLLASWLMDLSGNLYGTYGQLEGCPSCGAAYHAPSNRTVPRRFAARAAVYLDRASDAIRGPKPAWIHALLTR